MMIRKQNTCDQLYEFDAVRTYDSETLRDNFDSQAYHQLRDMFGNENDIKDDVFLHASTDEFSPFKNRSYEVLYINAINFNLPPEKRYLPQNVFPLALVRRKPRTCSCFYFL